MESILNNNSYNITKHLAKKLEFLSNADQYIKDALKQKDELATRTWETIKKDEETHASLLRDLLMVEFKAHNTR